MKVARIKFLEPIILKYFKRKLQVLIDRGRGDIHEDSLLSGRAG
jgi:hypothetical protein